MTWQEQGLEFFRTQREGKIEQLQSLQSGNGKVSEMRYGERVDTTDESIARLQEHIAELGELIEAAEKELGR